MQQTEVVHFLERSDPRTVIRNSDGPVHSVSVLLWAMATRHFDELAGLLYPLDGLYLAPPSQSENGEFIIRYALRPKGEQP